jgi:hypothetical protein
VINLCLLGGDPPGRRAWPVVLGAVLPDLPGYTFWACHRLAGLTDPQIWGELYPQPFWQDLLGPFHSLPLALALLLLGALIRRPGLSWFAASWLLHAVLDVPLHHTDAPRFLFPFSDLRFRSPISYWDRAYHADVVAVLELLALLGGATYLALRTRRALVRVALGVTCAGMVALYASGALFWNSLPPETSAAAGAAVPPPPELQLLPPSDGGGARRDDEPGANAPGPGRERVRELRR